MGLWSVNFVGVAIEGKVPYRRARRRTEAAFEDISSQLNFGKDYNRV